MTTVGARPIPWDIYEEHLSEAGWLWGEWERAMDSAIYALGDVVVGPEDRLAAHLDGLVLGGARVAKKLLLPALAGDDADVCAAAAWALVQSEDGDFQDAVVDALASAEPPARATVARALLRSPNLDVSRVARLWHVGPPALRPMVLAVFGRREPDWVRVQAEAAFRGGDPALCAEAWRALRTAPDPNALPFVDESLRSPDAAVRAEAMVTGFLLGARSAWSACRQAAGQPGEACRLPLGLLATSPHADDRALVRAALGVQETRPHALWALGFGAEVDDGDRLVEAMADPEPDIAKIAGEAFATMTGVAIVGALAVRGETKGPDAEEVGDDDPPPTVRQEEHLPHPEAANMGIWWRRHRGQFRPGVRHLGGAARTPDSVGAALGTAATWRRTVLWLELAALGRAPSGLDLRDWARDQRRALGG